MIRINLLGQIRPKASRRPVDTGAALPALFIGAGLVLGVLVLGFLYYSWQRQLNAENSRIKVLQAQKTDSGKHQATGRSVRQGKRSSPTESFDD